MVSPFFKGGRPRPSLKWQPEQETRLKVGPKPSNWGKDEGAVTQLVLNSRLPKVKSLSLSVGSVGIGLANASSLMLKTVAESAESAVELGDASQNRLVKNNKVNSGYKWGLIVRLVLCTDNPASQP